MSSSKQAFKAVNYHLELTKNFKYSELQQCCMQCKTCEEEHDNLHNHVVNEHLTDSKVVLFCGHCEKPFCKYSYRVNNGEDFCTRDCADKFKAKDGLDTECTECGNEIHIPPSHVKEVDGYEQKNHFCDKECESSFKTREWVGENHPSWDGGRERLYCNECGDEYYVKPANVDESKYCSAECRVEASVVEVDEYECANCGDTVEKMAHNVKGEETTCSKECYKEHMSSIRKGEDNPQWEGGRFDYYGPNWPEQREKTLERDEYCCQNCDMTRDEHYQNYNEDLHVHHKVKRRQIIDENEPTIEQFELSNSLDNLVTLCKSCHRKLEN